MMTLHKRYKSIFSDKASMVARMMLLEPEKKWVVRDFVDNNGMSLGLAHGVISAMEKYGYIERIIKGPVSFTLLTEKKSLIEDWLKEYRFDMNGIDTYYSADKNILKKIKKLLDKNTYALTMHTGANLTTSYVNTDDIYLYLKSDNWRKDTAKIRQKLELKELVKGGNIHLIQPFYKASAFFNSRFIKGCPVVSDLQLYLDLYHFSPRGHEHSEYLKSLLEEKGKNLA